jgi:hypothetical protein
MIGKPYSGKPNVRFDEGELEVELSATTPALYSTVTPKKENRYSVVKEQKVSNIRFPEKPLPTNRSSSFQNRDQIFFDFIAKSDKVKNGIGGISSSTFLLVDTPPESCLILHIRGTHG